MRAEDLDDANDETDDAADEKEIPWVLLPIQRIQHAGMKMNVVIQIYFILIIFIFIYFYLWLI